MDTPLRVDVTTCRSCPQRIFFARTNPDTGSLMPINAEPDPAGNIRIFHAAGAVYASSIGKPKQDPGLRDHFYPDETWYMPHWATCPNPNQWRKG